MASSGSQDKDTGSQDKDTGSQDKDIAFAQDLLPCTLCSNNVELVCKSCGVDLCGNCAGPHMLSEPEKKHDIIKYDQKYLTTPRPLCPNHTDQICDLFCQKCDVPVCAKCIANKSHFNHSMVEISDVYDEKFNFIIQETKLLEETLVPKYDEIIDGLKRHTTEVPIRNSVLKGELRDHGEKLQRLIQGTIDKYIDSIEATEKQDLSHLKDNLSRFENVLGEMHQAIQRNKEMLRSKNTQMFGYRPVVEKFQRVPPRVSVTFASFLPGAIDKTQFLGSIGVLTSSATKEEGEYIIPLMDHLSMVQSHYREVLPRSVITATADTTYNELFKISWLKLDEAWISGNDKTITRVNSKGSVLEKIATKSGRSTNGLVVWKNADLLYIDCYDKKVVMVKNKKMTTLIKTDWKPTEISCTLSGDILISLWNNLSGDDKRFKILRYSRDGLDLKQEIRYRENGQPLFQSKGPHCAIPTAENRNGDICAADWNAGVLLLLNKIGKLKLKYTGLQSVVFDPRYIATDSQGHILVSDYDNNCVHILNEAGHLVSLIEYLRRPEGISIDDQDNLWLVERGGKLKVIKYLE
ncbi:uncharacterized protein LOC125671636 [Ostrea edulis]|uniref:uncharacterized protein LOC125671636 n=1 Tax=Ostrea edulis TaxID=37623 RepID=UPI0024AEB024|nr:uncharacterized protein LOC125671636 [Ostrea edulis]